jgi:hypothetical protein
VSVTGLVRKIQPQCARFLQERGESPVYPIAEALLFGLWLIRVSDIGTNPKTREGRGAEGVRDRKYSTER